MTIRIVNSVKYVGLFALILFSVIACEKDFENIGIGLVDNNQFTTKDTVFEVIAYNKNVDSSRVDGIPQFLLGVYKDDNFGFIKATFVSQLGLPLANDFGDNVSIDAVVLDIPYYVTDTSTVLGIPDFKLDSIIGDQSIEYNISVYQSGTFLNTLDPLDPTKSKTYYSGEDYINGEQLYSNLFKPNRNDTVLYVDRRFMDADPNTVDDIDTIKKSPLLPSIKIPLDTLFFRNNFINQENSGVFDSFDNFINHFRGLIIEANGAEGSLMTLAMSDATVTIYYTNTILTSEALTNTDLNGDGDTDDTEVPIRTKQSKEFPIFGIRVNQFNRNYSGSAVESRFLNPDINNGEDKLYIQGAAGSISVLELFKGMNLDEIRNENWLINEANLTLYVDKNVFNNTNVPEKLLLYRFEENSQILDVFTEAQINGLGGDLERDDNNEPLRYKFRITDYISEVLKSEDPLSIEKFGLKVFHSSDTPNFLVATDTIIKDFSWIAKGVVLKGNNLLNINDPERLKLEIFYTINNE